VTGAITDRDARYALGIVDTICTDVGPGLPGSTQERGRAAILKNELEAHLGTGNTEVEEFEVAPGAFLGSLPIGALLTLAAAILTVTTGRFAELPVWTTIVAGLVCSTAAVLVVALEFVFYVEVVDRFAPHARSVNVVGRLRRPGTRDVERLLLVSGHHDSAPENTWLHLLGYGGLVASATMLIGFVAMFALCVVQVVVLLAGDGAARIGTPSWIVLAYPVAPSIVIGLSFTSRRKNGGTVPGAVDNLAASAVVVSLCRFLVEHPAFIPPDTEVRFVSFGSEEAGVRGSRRYVERHREELKRLDARLLNFEMIAHPMITILSSDLSGTVSNSPEMVESVLAAARAAGVPHVVKPAGPGVGTDAGPFSRAGLKAATLLPFKMPEQLVAFYHQRQDRPEVLTIAPLSNVLELALEWIRSGGGRQAVTDRP
jgi:hypothetical protein